MRNPFTGHPDFYTDLSSTTIPTGSTNYAQINPSSAQTGPVNLTTGTIRHLNVSTAVVQVGVTWPGNYTQRALPRVSVKDFGATDNGITDNDATSIQATIDYVSNTWGGGDVLLPSGTYYLQTTTLVLDKPWVRLIGEGMPHRTDAGGSASGTTLYYVGTSTAIRIGTETTEWIWGVSMENIRLRVAETTHTGIVMWGPGYGYLKNVAVFGNSGAGRYGIYVAGSITYRFELVDVNGHGTQTTLANYLGHGIYFTSHVDPNAVFPTEIASATDLVRCYFRYCNTGVRVVGALINFNECDIEANDKGLNQDINSTVNITNTKFEANNTYDYYFSAPTSSGSSITNISGSFFNGYSRQTFFDGGGSNPIDISISNTLFTSDHAQPYLFEPSVLVSTTHRVNFSHVAFKGTGKWNILVSSTGVGSDKVKFTDMETTVYRFIQTNVAANTTYNNVPFEGVTVSTYAYMRDRGNVVAVNIYYSSSTPITSGYDVSTRINGTDLSQLSFPTIGANQTGPVTQYGDYLKHRVVAGDKLSAYLHTNAAFAPTGGSFIYEVVVAHGQDGKPN